MSTAGAAPFSHIFFYYYSILCCCCGGGFLLLLCMAAKGGTSRPACAACKHQRRKCTADCPLALYFPADQPKQFQNAHRLFGVSNILRILRGLDPAQKSEAMKSILYEANVRECFPVDGCVGLIFNLQRRIYQLQVELEHTNAQIAMYKSDQHDQHQHYHYSTHLRLAPSASSTPQSPFPPVIDNLNTGASDAADVASFDLRRCQIHRTHMGASI